MRFAVAGAVISSVVLAGFSAGEPPRPRAHEGTEVRKTVRELVQGKDVHWWARRSRGNARKAAQNERNSDKRGLTIARLKVRWRPTVDHAILLASIVYGVDVYEMHRVASCESGHNPAATNGRYRGVFQEGPMFERGPFGRLSVFDPYANALTAAHAVKHDGSWRQWECKP